jgi:hypothetical protein
MEGQFRYISGSFQFCQSKSWTPIMNVFNFPGSKDTVPTSCLDAKLKGMDKEKGSGFYWINPTGMADAKNAFVAHCDMTSAGGGWMLAAKITHDFAWICPERKGTNCFHSNVDPLRANLFHFSHARDFIDLRITQDENSGVHLTKRLIRKIFESKFGITVLFRLYCVVLILLLFVYVAVFTVVVVVGVGGGVVAGGVVVAGGGGGVVVVGGGGGGGGVAGGVVAGDGVAGGVGVVGVWWWCWYKALVV